MRAGDTALLTSVGWVGALAGGAVLILLLGVLIGSWLNWNQRYYPPADDVDEEEER